MVVFYIILISFFFIEGLGGTCKPRSFGKYAIVCVCDDNYCDDLHLLSNVTGAVVYESNREGARFQSTRLNFSSTVRADVPVFSPNRSEIYQFILGFGGAFTDAFGINLNSLSKTLQKKLLNSYFAENGLQYSMGRVPMASTDFSTRPYSYDDVTDDFSLKYFQLAKEDLLHKIPFIQAADTLSGHKLLLFGSPWSAPAWMKSNGAMNGKGSLKGKPGDKYHKTWANYFVRFLQAYQEHNITFWGLTMQNEPTDGCLANFSFQAMCSPPHDQRDFLKLDLGPALQAAGLGPDRLKVMIMDDVRGLLPRWADVVMGEAAAARYVSGLAFHWYLGDIMPHRILDVTHARHPGLFFLATEACAAYLPWQLPKVDLGNWERGEEYASDIIQDLLNWSVGWIDWNLALNTEGGPNWVENFVDSPVIVHAEQNEFYKQPMYYVLAHFSKCLPRGSYRIGLDRVGNLPSNDHLQMAAFQTPGGEMVVIVLNSKDDAVQFSLQDSRRGYLNQKINGHALQSYVW